ncbi:cell division protein FtsL [[Eubacterium] hominis]|uniref:cell division protein FtsL n=1 Tax=[Eubacterium] hominis TaxID=2764325 RepID=UPI003A4D7F79
MAKAKIVKRKRKLRIEGLATLMFTVAILVFLGAKYGLQSYNYSLSVQKTKLEQNQKELEEKVADLETTVTNLQSRENIMKVAEKENLKTNQDNVTVIDGNKE